jgi:hypothetical protein
MRAPCTFVLLLLLVLSVSAQEPKPANAPARTPAAAPPAPTPAEKAIIEEVLAFERNMEAAVVKGDVKYLATILPPDFTFTHVDAWTEGKQGSRTDTKESWLASVAKRPYDSRDVGPVGVELHGDIAITYGRYKMHQPTNPGFESSVWFERVYAKRNGQWQYVSHRTVHGPVREPDPSYKGRDSK